MTAAQAPDIEAVLAEHWKVDDAHGFYTCACGRTLGEVGVTPTLDVDPRWRAHVAERIAAAGFVRPEDVAEAQAKAWREGAITALDFATRDEDGIRLSLDLEAHPNPYAAALRPVDAPEGGASRG